MASADQGASQAANSASVSDPGGGSTDPSQGRNPYYTATYFSPFYFYGSSVKPSSTSSQAAGRDAGCYSALVSLLTAIGLFDAVIFGDPTGAPAAGANAHPLAIVTPKGWEETDETDPVVWVRRVLFTIRIVIQVDDATTPFDQLDQLAATVQSQLDQADLGGQCLASLTKIRAGRYGTANAFPEWSIDLDGEFTELVDSSACLIPL